MRRIINFALKKLAALIAADSSVDCAVDDIVDFIKYGQTIKIGGVEASSMFNEEGCILHVHVDNGYQGVADHLSVGRAWLIKHPLLMTPNGGRCLDLISHSEGIQTFLNIGRWTIDDTVTTSERFVLLENAVSALSIQHVRLLGCATATTDEGIRAMRRIVAALGGGVTVWGTTSLISIDDFTRTAFTRYRKLPDGTVKDLLLSCSRDTPMLMPAALDLDSAFQPPFATRRADDSSPLAEIANFARGKVLPGLLATAHASSHQMMNGAAQVEALLNWHVLRITVNGRSICYPVTHPSAFAALFASEFHSDSSNDTTHLKPNE